MRNIEYKISKQKFLKTKEKAGGGGGSLMSEMFRQTKEWINIWDTTQTNFSIGWIKASYCATRVWVDGNSGYTNPWQLHPCASPTPPHPRPLGSASKESKQASHNLISFSCRVGTQQRNAEEVTISSDLFSPGICTALEENVEKRQANNSLFNVQSAWSASASVTVMSSPFHCTGRVKWFVARYFMLKRRKRGRRTA